MASGKLKQGTLQLQTYNFSKAVEAQTTTVLGTYTLSAGSWLILQFMDLNSHVAVSDGAYNSAIRIPNVISQTVRQMGHNGGGCINSLSIRLSQATTVNCEGYCPKAVTMRAAITAIRISD